MIQRGDEETHEAWRAAQSTHPLRRGAERDGRGAEKGQRGRGMITGRRSAARPRDERPGAAVGAWGDLRRTRCRQPPSTTRVDNLERGKAQGPNDARRMMLEAGQHVWSVRRGCRRRESAAQLAPPQLLALVDGRGRNGAERRAAQAGGAGAAAASSRRRMRRSCATTTPVDNPRRQPPSTTPVDNPRHHRLPLLARARARLLRYLDALHGVCPSSLLQKSDRQHRRRARPRARRQQRVAGNEAGHYIIPRPRCPFSAPLPSRSAPRLCCAYRHNAFA
jgi:hypothetical protein